MKKKRAKKSVKKSYKAKSFVGVCLFLIPALFVFVVFGVQVGYDFIVNDFDDIREHLSIWFFVVYYVFIGFILFLILNLNPVRINIDGDEIEFVYVCRNKIRVNIDDVKVLSYVDYGKTWYAIVHVRMRLMRISSAEFPALKYLFEKT